MTDTDSTPSLHPRIESELTTIRAMIGIYCRAHHHNKNTLCPDCDALFHYAEKRLHNCPFQENKPTCGKCSIHCYKPGMRDKVRDVMRFAGPRMIWHHPIMAIRHLLDSHRKSPQRPHRKKCTTDNLTSAPEDRRTLE